MRTSEVDRKSALDKQEIFVDIAGYEGVYAISNMGRVMSYGGKSNHKNDIIMKPSLDKNGYRKITLKLNNKQSTRRICRLVAEAFLDNTNNLPMVNHINKIKSDDFVANLEWIDNYGNWKHSESDMSRSEIEVIQKSLDGEYIATHPSLMEASRASGARQGNITHCLKGKISQTGGFKWEMK